MIDLPPLALDFLQRLRPQSWSFLDLIGQEPFPVPWTPVLTFDTPGDLAVVYTLQVGYGRTSGNMTNIWFRVTAVITHTTAAGNLLLSGLPFTSAPTIISTGTVVWGGITKANYTQVVPVIAASASQIQFAASGSAQANASVTAADTPTGGTMFLRGHICHIR